MLSTGQLRYFQPGGFLSVVCLITALFVTFPASSQNTGEQAKSEVVIDDINSPSNTVNLLHTRLLEVMKNAEALGFEGRYNILSPVITENFDTQLIVRTILSRIWKTLDTQKKIEFIKLFNRLSVATYASRFDAYNGEKFEELGQKKLNKKGRLIVETQFIRIDDDPVKFNYLMHQKDGKWFIISVIADGINDLSLKRAEYAAVIKEKGFDGLVKDIESNIYKLENGSEG